MFSVTLEFLSGLVFGIEHVAGLEDDEYDWFICIHLGFVRLVIMSID